MRAFMSMGADQGDFHSFFAFDKYVLANDEGTSAAKSIDTIKNSKHSHCGMTLLGWYKQLDRDTHRVKGSLCYWGERVSSLEGTVIGQEPGQAGVPSTFLAPKNHNGTAPLNVGPMDLGAAA